MKKLTLHRVHRVTTFVQVKRTHKHLNGTKHMKKQAMPLDYPIVDGHRFHFVHFPVEVSPGIWKAAEVLTSGYIDPTDDPTKRPFDNEKACKAACKIHNNYHGWNEKQSNDIVSYSMGLKAWPKKFTFTNH